MLQRLLDARDKARAQARPSAGFTLIELLIVIVILGVLAGVVVFAVSAFNNRGEEAACKSDFKAVEVAAEAYRANMGAYPGSIDALVPDYLREPPSSPNCTISLAADGTLTVSGIYNETTGGGGPAPTTTTTSPPVAPSTPAGLSISNIQCVEQSGPDFCSVTASWTASSGSPDPTYQWDRDDRQGFGCDSGDFQGGMVSDSTSGTSVNMTGIPENDGYCFRVRAVNSAGQSNYAYVSFNTPNA